MGQAFRMTGLVLCNGMASGGDCVFRFLDPRTSRIQAILLASGNLAPQLSAVGNATILTTVQGTVVQAQPGVPPVVRVSGVTAASLPAAAALRSTQGAADPPQTYFDCLVRCIADLAGGIAVEEVINSACGFSAIAMMPDILTIAAAATAIEDLPLAVIGLIICAATTWGLSVGDVFQCIVSCAFGVSSAE